MIYLQWGEIMELGVEILSHYLAQENARIVFPELRLSAAEIVEKQCYQILLKIRDIVRDDSLDDGECFERIERIVCEFEEIGVDCGNRHDFG